METIVQGIGILLGLGVILTILFRLLRLAVGLGILALFSFLVFVELYGIYLLFTEFNLYVEDFKTNGFMSFSGCLLLINLMFLFSIIWIRRQRKRV
ncbi:DUF5966 family protein [Streptococcus loxodontisalivarius]|uniref:Tellurium resistance membrane protein TerC n=1 Tax=Streptococcus loxodontisalivarius TaxID=1349415 RepID=A0ABS2PPZ8_9STRE|nr:DUF5966 family protein [Streptococcus loxodontisalivarius]MBM7642050.1 putative tellurium resistance membrane protein TerC [Streptococcus loxodontisalivarius]